MRKLNILFLDWRLSRNLTESALSSELNSSIFNLTSSLKKQLRNNDDLGKEMMTLLESGEMLTTEIIGRFISRNLKTIDGDILLPEYPRTLEQYDGLRKVLKSDNIELESIWYFKQREPNQFMTDHFENPKEKQWIEKYGSEIIDKWKTEFNKRREQINEIQNLSDKTKWKTIEMDYVADLSTEYIKQRIKDCA
ncbi:nucleoside monophosphate kinase [Cellulophaga baltica]|uniref:nucleoside monophosphate kinase n=1 Tax=Cellulophaga baltica TaxID=76594 RepID=UPI002147A288|nr:nucleoside monophosphate kinase [Cellulophaga baltica]MCR1026112.1 nucleoside monophosphate kinase [Cellulophaga baltica]MCR1026647.1 nucleoside monophosphate kinase [Cellulophaga baltica]